MRIDQETLASISTPDHAETRLGTLEFADGGPSEDASGLHAVTGAASNTGYADSA